MLIPQDKIIELLKLHNIKVTGVLHVGAHECEELAFYSKIGLTPNDIIWIEAMEHKVIQSRAKGIPNVYCAVVSDQDNQIIPFNVANNGQSSSILEFGTHSSEHPEVRFVGKQLKTSTTLNIFFKGHAQFDPSKYNFWNFDIQGAELKALLGATELIKNPTLKVLYLEVNQKELYKGCALVSQIDSFLSQFGFTRKETVMTRHGWGDAIYLRVNSVPRETRLVMFDNCDMYQNGEHRFYTDFINTGSDVENKIIFDVGCRDFSLFTDFKGEVHYFDPMPKYVDTLKRAVSLNKASYFNVFGLGAANESLTYYEGTGSFVKRGCNRTPNATQVLEIRTGASYIEEKNIEKIDFIKIDTEGFELDVLRGFGSHLNKVKTIQFEYGGTYKDRGIKLSDVIDYLKPFGFTKFFYITNLGLRAITDFKDHYRYSNIVTFKN